MPKKGTLSVTRLHQNRIEWWCVHGCLLRKDFYHITVATIPLFWLPTMNVMGRIRSRDLPTHLHMNTDSATRVKWVERWIRKISEFKTPVLTSFWCCRLGQPNRALLLIDHFLHLSNGIMKLLNCISWQYLVDVYHKNTILWRDNIHVGDQVLQSPGAGHFNMRKHFQSVMHV